MNFPPRLPASIFLSAACLVSTASATTFLIEDFEGTNPAFVTTNINPGNAVTGSQALVVDPTFSPGPADQNYVEILYPGIFAFGTKSVDLNTVGIQFTVTLPTAQLLTLSFDYGIDIHGGPNAGARGAVVQFLDSISGLQVGPTLSSTPVANGTASYTSTPFLMAAGTYNLQFASDTYSTFRGVQLDNILLEGTAVTSSVPDDGSALVMSGLACLLLLGCRRRSGA